MSVSPFLGADAAADRGEAAAVLLPVPYDATSSWVKGADRGPAALLEASGYVELHDVETGTEPWRRGLATRPPLAVEGLPPEEMADVVRTAVGEELDAGRLPVVLGGEHSVTIGAVEAAADRFDDLTVLQLDAHADTRESYHGSTHNHACVMARARERARLVQVGLRSVDPSELEGLVEERVFWAHEIVGAGEGWTEEAAALLGPSTYVTVDLDVFDPSVLPATGTPEPGGLDWYALTGFLRRVARSTRVVGFDVVELAPGPGQHASAFTAAKLVHRFLAEIFAAEAG